MLKQDSSARKERLFICPCSKSYFSYAALFTHIKQKHDGKPPGHIIKPTPHNKRGRPPKKTPIFQKPLQIQRQQFPLNQRPFKSFSSSPSLQEKGSIFDLKSSAKSQFKQYKESSFISTQCQMPSKNRFQSQIIRDLSRYLEIKALKLVPHQIIDSMGASLEYLEQTNSDMPVKSLKSFLLVCKEGLRPETYSQVLFLLTLLLEHIQKASKTQQSTPQSSPQFHRHIISFFDFINTTSQTVDLSSFGIFSDLNTIKTLIVFFNWLGRKQGETSRTQKDGEQE